MRSYAVIPAAGRSRRMGQPKLLLPWGQATLIEHVIATWRASRVDRIALVVHPDDTQLADLAARAGAHVIQPAEPPAEMRVSVDHALRWIATLSPELTDAWLLAPADMPGLSAATIDRLLTSYESRASADDDTKRVWMASWRGRHGHPVLFPWSLAADVAALRADEGLNALVSRCAVEHVESEEMSILDDLDTPADYERLRPRESS